MRTPHHLLPALALILVATTGAAQTLPPDAKSTCGMSPALFNSWFSSGSVSSGGLVNPANSLALNTSSNCNFYLWSQQMFLWLTSPAAKGTGGSGRVFDSDVFFDVSTEDDTGARVFIPHGASNPGAALKDKTRSVGLRVAKPGPHGLPVVVDRAGNIIELVPPPLGATGKPLVLGMAGQKSTRTEVAYVTVTKDQRAVFYGVDKKVIQQPKPILRDDLRGARIGQRFFTEDRTPIIVGPTGVVFDVSPAQAGSNGVLLAQTGSIVYYSIVVNDVFAYFASGVKTNKISATQFPTTQPELDAIQSFAGASRTFTDGNALAIEAKLSWVETTNLPNAEADYITTTAQVPIYDTTTPNAWKSTGQSKTATLALVGVHIVGSTQGHPEMIWSTFEHVRNSPNGEYQYVNSSDQVVTVTNGPWLFSKTGPFNVMHASYDSQSATINSAHGYSISPSDTQRVYAFGVAPTGVPNQEDKTPADANTEIISVNNSVQAALAAGDIRKNYYFVGSTWTFGGWAPTGAYSPTGDPNGAEIGTNMLANSTMETYVQATNGSSGTNCFSCHRVGSNTPPKTPATTGISHIFNALKPLPTTLPSAGPQTQSP